MKMRNIRQQVYRLIADDEQSKRGTWAKSIIASLIVFSLFLAVVATEPAVMKDHQEMVRKLDVAIALIFLVEFAARVWTSPLTGKFEKGVKGKIKYVLTPLALLDVIAILPSLIGLITPELYLLRIFRLARTVRLGRSKRIRSSISYFNKAILSKKTELQISAVYSGFVMFFSSVAMYMAEGTAQPVIFGSIPRCLWWSVITVTTVGYGDTYPITPLGKVVAALTAILGIAAIAIPIGIISAGFTEAIQEKDSAS